MKKLCFIINTLLSLLVLPLFAITTDSGQRTVICLANSDENDYSNFRIQYAPAYFLHYGLFGWKKADRENSSDYKWVFENKKSFIISSERLPSTPFIEYLVEPGDSIQLNNLGDKFIFTGKGAEKFNLAAEISNICNSAKMPSNKRYYDTISAADFSEWNQYLDTLTNAVATKINAYRDKISPEAFEYFMAKSIYKFETKRQSVAIYFLYDKRNTPLSNQERCEIYDTTLVQSNSNWLRQYEKPIAQGTFIFYSIFLENERKSNFNRAVLDSLNDKKFHLQTILEEGARRYRGEVFKAFEIVLHTQQGMHYYARKPEMEKMFATYLQRERDSTTLNYLRKDEVAVRFGYLKKGKRLFEFSFTDNDGNIISNEIIKNKIACLSFFDGKDLSQQSLLNEVKRHFINNKNVMFLNISSRYNGQNSPKKQKKSRDIYLYTSDAPDDFTLRIFHIKKFPGIYLVDTDQRILINTWDSVQNNPQELINKIKKSLAENSDGPYVFNEYGSKKAYHIQDGKVTVQKIDKNETLKAQTDLLQSAFTFVLKSSFEMEPAEYTKPPKIIAFSDIEGNFDALRKLLQSSKIIDESFNWIFGTGHLVFAGDMFDRGNQVTECLWLIYSLEEKAKIAGGYVHFVLGNHEIMNMQGDHRYVTKKYNTNAGLMGKSVTELYAENSELGIWLRTKNIVEKIGDLLFMHGGISSELNKSGLSIQDINQLARPYYAEAKKDYGNRNVNTIMSSKTGPLWFRGYYDKKNKTDEATVDGTLKQFDVKHIVTGHTVVSPRFITVHYNNKVINTDTKHKEGKSEALLIEGNNFYRVNAEGNRELLFKEGDSQSNKK